jgi:hypothetical protein
MRDRARANPARGKFSGENFSNSPMEIERQARTLSPVPLMYESFSSA